MYCRNIDQLAEIFQSICNRGYVQTHRSGDTGVGKTLEDLLGISENNDEKGDIKIGDGRLIELKSFRKNGSNPVTLFSKEPPRRERRLWNTELISKFGYTDGERDALYTTLSVGSSNPQGLYLTCDAPFVEVNHEELGCLSRYPQSVLRNKFENKFPELIAVEADSRGDGTREMFHYTNVKYLTGFDENEFFRLLKQGDVMVDTRMHCREDGTLRNHGTAWRINKGRLPELFSSQTDLLHENVDSNDVQRLGQQFLTDYI